MQVIHFHGGYRQNLSLLALGSTNAAEHVEDRRQRRNPMERQAPLERFFGGAFGDMPL